MLTEVVAATSQDDELRKLLWSRIPQIFSTVCIPSRSKLSLSVSAVSEHRIVLEIWSSFDSALITGHRS